MLQQGCFDFNKRNLTIKFQVHLQKRVCPHNYWQFTSWLQPRVLSQLTVVLLHTNPRNFSRANFIRDTVLSYHRQVPVLWSWKKKGNGILKHLAQYVGLLSETSSSYLTVAQRIPCLLSIKRPEMFSRLRTQRNRLYMLSFSRTGEIFMAR